MTARFAIFLPPSVGSALEEFAVGWLGRSHMTGKLVPQPAFNGIAPERLEAITGSPRHYGFHGTLKAPFELARGRTADDLVVAARDFAAALKPFSFQATIGSLSGFLALLPKAPCLELNNLAADCVRHFDLFRAPMRADDIERRRQSNLSERQDVQMRRWGYPYIFDDFRFHMTLTDRLAEPELSDVQSILRDAIAKAISNPFRVTEIAIYAQSGRDRSFTCLERLPFGSVLAGRP